MSGRSINTQGHSQAEAQLGASWSWAPDEWSWMPTEGPLKARLGPPPKYARLEVTTAPVPPPERYAFWREIVWPDWDDDRPTAAQRRDFRAAAQGLFCGERTLVTFESDPTSGGRARPPASEQGGALHVGLILSGERLSEAEGDGPHRAQAGDLYAYDPDRAAQVRWPRRHRGVNLMIPRVALTQIFGHDVPPATALLAALSQSALAPLVAVQFRLMAQQASLFNDSEAEAAVGGTVELILAGLRSAHSTTARDDSAPAAALLLAARRYIENHLAERDLDAGRIAAALGCSRATLYRIFAEHDLTVSEAIRDVRLVRFRHLLRSQPSTASIAAAAARCGLGDPRHVRRQFKAVFGLSPKDFRATAGREH